MLKSLTLVKNMLLVKAYSFTQTCNLELTNKEASTVLCSVVKHAGSGRARKKCRGKHETQSSVFPHFLPLPKCFTTEHSTVEASLFVL